MKLHTAPTPNGRKPLIALAELDAPYELRWVDLRAGEQKSPEFLALNPNRKIPVLEDDGLVIWESGAILLYLAEKFGKLLPKSPKGRWEAIQHTFFQVGGIGPNAGRLLGEFRKKPEERSAAVIDAARPEVARLLGVADTVLADGREYLAGEYSIADIMHYAWTRAVLDANVEGVPTPARLVAWLDRIAARAAVQREASIRPK